MAKQILYRIKPWWSEVFIYAALGLGPLGVAVSSSAQAVSTRFAIENPQVVRAMAAASLPVEAVEVKIAAPITSVKANTVIEVESVSPIGHHAVRLRLECRDSECLPFFAEVTFPDAVDVTKLRGLKTSRDAAVQGSQTASQTSVSESSSKPAPARDVPTLRAGAPATLVFDEDRIHIRLEVISLQAGRAGSRVRVSSPDHKQIYVAEVVTPTLVKGELSQ